MDVQLLRTDFLFEKNHANFNIILLASLGYLGKMVIFAGR